jgi:hypothetical protein
MEMKMDLPQSHRGGHQQAHGLRAAEKHVGLLLNFNSRLLTEGIRRRVL